MGVPPPNVKPGLNVAFLHQFMAIMQIAIPRLGSKESGLLTTHAFFLLLRTYLSLVVARMDGELVRDLIAGKGKDFLVGLAKWLSVGVIGSYTNSMIKFLQAKISIAFRTRLTRYIHDLYLGSHMAYYKMHALDGGIEHGADQFICRDLTLFCDNAANLYSSLGILSLLLPFPNLKRSVFRLRRLLCRKLLVRARSLIACGELWSLDYCLAFGTFSIFTSIFTTNRFGGFILP